MSESIFHIIETDGRYFRNRGTAPSRGDAERVVNKKSAKGKNTWWIVASHNVPTRILARHGVLYVAQGGISRDIEVAIMEIAHVFRDYEKERKERKRQHFINLKGRKLSAKFIAFLLAAVIVIFGITLSNQIM